MPSYAQAESADHWTTLACISRICKPTQTAKLTDMQVPLVVAEAKRALAGGQAVVIGLQATGEGGGGRPQPGAGAVVRLGVRDARDAASLRRAALPHPLPDGRQRRC